MPERRNVYDLITARSEARKQPRAGAAKGAGGCTSFAHTTKVLATVTIKDPNLEYGSAPAS